MRGLFDDLCPGIDQGNSFHQRDELPADQVAAGEAAAQTQEATILEWFRKHPGASVTAPEVLERTGLRCLLTSVRRALCNLKKSGHIEKTGKQTLGEYGVNISLWRLRTDLEDVALLSRSQRDKNGKTA